MPLANQDSVVIDYDAGCDKNGGGEIEDEPGLNAVDGWLFHERRGVF